jgi:hypothetical protein
MSRAIACLLAMMPLVALAEPQPAAKLDLAHRWVYLSTNMLVDQNVQDCVKLMERAAKAGYTGIVLTDSKFMRWDSLPKTYAANAAAVADACRRLKLDLVACVMPIGYSSGLLARDPNLAEGMPVRDAPFVVRQGKVEPDDPIRLVNGGFEQSKDNRPTGWNPPDSPGAICFVDTDVFCEGKASFRMQDIGKHSPEHGLGRISQRLAVKPFRYYHLSGAVRTQDFDTKCRVQLTAIGKGRNLVFHELPVKANQDWTRYDSTFNTMEYEEALIYVGVWGGKTGRIWFDDLRLEPGGLVNVIRRDGAALVVASEDGQTAYEEGRDFAGASDPLLLGKESESSAVWHRGPQMTVPAGSRLREGQRLQVSYFHPGFIHGGKQVMCCMSEPKVYEILAWQVEQVRDRLRPDGYFMQHDEIRCQGWDDSCVKRNLTPGQILADNTRRCTEIIRKAAAGKPIYVWSDMYDPTHNAKPAGHYYLVKGDGPWSGAWEGLDKDVTVVNWHLFERDRAEALKHFAGRGHKQILAGYYDAPPERMRPWLEEAAAVTGVVGAMYTTWKRQYDDLEKFAEELDRVSPRKAR